MNKVIWSSDNHSQIQDTSKLATIKFISKIKENAIIYSNITASIVASDSVELPSEVVSHIPKINSLKRLIQRIRKKDFPVQLPNCIEKLKFRKL